MKKIATDLTALDALEDEDIKQAVDNDPDAAPIPKTLKHARRGLQKHPTKIPVSIRLTPDVLEYFKASGKGWQSRIDQVLMEHMRISSKVKS